ncbi:MAG: dipeptide epimerase [Pseudomonadota bacterium]
MSALRLTLSISSPKLVRPFVIATGARTHQPYLSVRLSAGPHSGRGAATGIAYLGASPESLHADIEAVRSEIETGIDRTTLRSLLPAGGARSALDAALWDLEAAQSGSTVAERLGVDPAPIASAYTIVLDTPEAMAKQAGQEAWRPLLKVKLGGSPADEESRLRAVAMSAPDTRKVIDANAAWSVDQLTRYAPVAARCGYELLEQPLPAGSEQRAEMRESLAAAAAHIPLCADESLQTRDDLALLKGLYQAVNIKLDKCGGLTSALAIRDAAKADGLSIFIGCMLAPTLAIAPAHLLAQGADYADLDGPFWFEDEPVKLTSDGLFAPIDPAIWGTGETRAND